MTIVNFSSKSLVPLYELVDREATMEYDGFNGEDRYQALKSYMTDGSIGADFSTYKCGTVTEFTVPSFADAKYNETLIKDIYLDGQWVGQVCNEYIPNINRDKRVTVVYPVVNNKPRYNMGFYLGDGKSHKPARVSWSGTNVSVEEYDELDYEKATTVYLRGASVLPKLPEGSQGRMLLDNGEGLQIWLDSETGKVTIQAQLDCTPNIERQLLQMESQMNVCIARYRQDIINTNNK